MSNEAIVMGTSTLPTDPRATELVHTICFFWFLLLFFLVEGTLDWVTSSLQRSPGATRDFPERNRSPENILMRPSSAH